MAAVRLVDGVASEGPVGAGDGAAGTCCWCRTELGSGSGGGCEGASGPAFAGLETNSTNSILLSCESVASTQADEDLHNRRCVVVAILPELHGDTSKILSGEEDTVSTDIVAERVELYTMRA